MQDDFKWKVEELELVAGVDISFSGKFQNGACAGLVIYSLKTKKIIY
jgi:deoxyinosine 3'endonuclease (endonuclease V)